MSSGYAPPATSKTQGAAEVPTNTPKRIRMRRETPKIPKLRLDLLLYTNMGAEALAKHLRTTKEPTTNQRTQQMPLDGAHSTSPSMNITTAPAGRHEAKKENGIRLSVDGLGQAADFLLSGSRVCFRASVLLLPLLFHFLSTM